MGGACSKLMSLVYTPDWLILRLFQISGGNNKRNGWVILGESRGAVTWMGVRFRRERVNGVIMQLFILPSTELWSTL